MTNRTAPEQCFEVKPLEWQGLYDKYDGGREYYGHGVFEHWYAVERVKDKCWTCMHHVAGKPVQIGYFKTRGKAQVAAQNDYEHRIRSVITIRTVDEVRREALEEAARLIECDGDALGGKAGAAKAIRELAPRETRTRQYPVAWRVRVASSDPEEWTLLPAGGGADYLGRSGYECQPLYKTPQPQELRWVSASYALAFREGLEAAKKAIADLPTPDSELIMEGHEQAYRAIEDITMSSSIDTVRQVEITNLDHPAIHAFKEAQLNTVVTRDMNGWRRGVRNGLNAALRALASQPAEEKAE